MNNEIKGPGGPGLADRTRPAFPEAKYASAEDRCAALEAELDDVRDRWMRAEAETANVRARARRDNDETRQYAVQKFAADVAEAAENLRRGVASLPPQSDGEPEIVTRLRDGFDGIERSFAGLLERNGIERHDPTGEVFNSALHQAMDQQVAADRPAGPGLQAWPSAGTRHGPLRRPAMVVVSTAPATHTQPA